MKIRTQLMEMMLRTVVFALMLITTLALALNGFFANQIVPLAIFIWGLCELMVWGRNDRKFTE